MQNINRKAAKFTPAACPQNSPVSSVNSNGTFTTAPATPTCLEVDESTYPSPSPEAHAPRQRTPCPKPPVIHLDNDELFLPPPPAPIPDLAELDTGPCGQIPGSSRSSARKFSWSSSSSRLDWTLSPNRIHNTDNKAKQRSLPVVKRNLDDEKARMEYERFPSHSCPQGAAADRRPPCITTEAHIHHWLSMSPQRPYCPGCGEDLRAYLS